MMTRVVCIVVVLCAQAAWAAGPIHHRIHVTLEPARGAVSVEDRISLPPALAASGPIAVRLNAGFGEVRALGASVQGMDAAGPRQRVYLLRLEPGGSEFTLRYSGAPLLPGGTGQEPGEWLDARGAHLGASSAWYPLVDGDAPFTFELEARVPAGWRAMAPGRAVPVPGGDGWTGLQPVDGLDLVAGPFIEYRREQGWGLDLVWLREADPALASTYLEAVARYVPFYSGLLGDYPFSKFAVVENLRQSGFGMPSFTLLGSRVMRLPFIPHTSLPHEVVHDWWGNGVLVDYAEGNWSEGLTAYLADHLLAESRGEGVRHRRDALARFRAATGDGTAFSPVHFVSRHDRRSQAVGYDKPMMLFHMARRARGDEAFIAALRGLVRSGLGRRVGAREVLRALAPPGEDWFRDWWLRPDAPRLGLECCRVTARDGGSRVTGTLRQLQPGAAFPLRVPLQVMLPGEGTAREHVVFMDSRETPFELRLPAPPSLLAVDAAFDLMRVPDAAELPPSLAETLAARDPVAVIDSRAPADLAAAYRRLAAGVGARVVAPVQAQGAGAVWLLGAGSVAAAPLRDALAREVPRGDSRVLAAREPTGRPLVLVSAASPAAARALARRLPHYGRYGLLGFAGETARNVFTGERAVAASPLVAVLDAATAPPALILEPRHPLAAP